MCVCEYIEGGDGRFVNGYNDHEALNRGERRPLRDTATPDADPFHLPVRSLTRLGSSCDDTRGQSSVSVWKLSKFQLISLNIGANLISLPRALEE